MNIQKYILCTVGWGFYGIQFLKIVIFNIVLSSQNLFQEKIWNVIKIFRSKINLKKREPISDKT